MGRTPGAGMRGGPRPVRRTPGHTRRTTAGSTEGEALVTSMKQWERKVLAAPGAPERVAQIEEELRLAPGLTRLRGQAGLSQRQLAERMGVRQPRIAAIERSHNVTVDVLERYVSALGGQIELSVVRGGKKVALISGHRKPAPAKKTPAKTTAPKNVAATTATANKTPEKTAHAKRTATAKASAAKRTARNKNA
jgi:transcriptional regulator with XRE-family HTH domain